MNTIDEIGIWTGANVKNSVGDIFEVKDIALIVHKSYNFENESWDKEVTPIISMKGIFGEGVSVSYEKLKQEYTWYKETKVKLPEISSEWEHTKYGEVGKVFATALNTIIVKYDNGIIRTYTDKGFYNNFVEVNKTK